MKIILDAIKEALLSFSPNRCFYEAMMKYDFKIGNPRQNLMQLCFAPLASWTLLILLTVIYIDPTKHLWSLQKIFSPESSIILLLLSGQVSAMLTFFVLFFLLEWIFRKEYLFVAVIFYFLAKSDLHIHLATTGILGIYFARACHMWWFHVDLESETRKIWHTFSNLLLLAWFITSVSALWVLHYLQVNQFFAGSMTANRFEFLFLLVVALYVITYFILCTWGHFYVRVKREPSYLPVHFSTEKWILKFNTSSYLKKLLQEKISETLPAYQKSALQFKELKDQSPGLGMNYLGETLDKEISYLQQASSRLTIE